MKKEGICNLFASGIDCSQVVAGEFEEKTGLSKETLRKMAACFGGGMMCGETCGAVCGAYMIIGLVHGHHAEKDFAQKQIMQEKFAQFHEKLKEKYHSTLCREILGHDISVPGEMDKVLEEGTMFTLCPCLVEDTIHILEDIL